MSLQIIVHVTIISGCLLATNNPNSAAGIVGTDRGWGYRQQCLKSSHSFHTRGRPGYLTSSTSQWTWYRFSRSILGWSNTYETEFQPVSLWSRGTNKMKWIKRTQAWNEDESFRETIKFTWITWIMKVFLPALLLVLVPPIAGGFVAYMTPPRGLGCRALSIMIYGLCQVFSVVLALIRSALEDDDRGIFLQYLFTGWRYWALSSLCWFGSLVAAIGGMLLQIVGVFRNCVCHTAAATLWWHIKEVNPAINMATDTQEARDSSYWWMWMGATSTVFMVVVCYTGWWYQRLVRRRFEYAVEELYIPPRIEGIVAGLSTDRPDSPFDYGGHDDTEPLLGRDETLQELDPVRLNSRGRGGVWNMLMKHSNSSSLSLPLVRVFVDDDGKGRGEGQGEEVRLSSLQSPKTT